MAGKHNPLGINASNKEEEVPVRTDTNGDGHGGFLELNIDSPTEELESESIRNQNGSNLEEETLISGDMAPSSKGMTTTGGGRELFVVGGGPTAGKTRIHTLSLEKEEGKEKENEKREKGNESDGSGSELYDGNIGNTSTQREIIGTKGVVTGGTTSNPTKMEDREAYEKFRDICKGKGVEEVLETLLKDIGLLESEILESDISDIRDILKEGKVKALERTRFINALKSFKEETNQLQVEGV